jgi:hypothetical protein
MQTTMDLLDRAASSGQSLSDVSRELGLNPNALHASKGRGHLSPAIAGALAERLGEDVRDWIVIAALESERDSACKDRMVKRLGVWRKRSLSDLLCFANALPFRVRNAISGWNVRACGPDRSPA